MGRARDKLAITARHKLEGELHSGHRSQILGAPIAVEHAEGESLREEALAGVAQGAHGDRALQFLLVQAECQVTSIHQQGSTGRLSRLDGIELVHTVRANEQITPGC